MRANARDWIGELAGWNSTGGSTRLACFLGQANCCGNQWTHIEDPSLPRSNEAAQAFVPSSVRRFAVKHCAGKDARAPGSRRCVVVASW